MKIYFLKTIRQKRGSDTNSDFKNRYSREANHKSKRQASASGTFPDGRNTCTFYLKVDPYLYKEIYENEGNSVI